MRMDLIFVLLLALSSCVNARIFYFIPEHKNWTEAQTYCRLHRTDLATADDQMDYDELLKAIPKDFTDYVWFGLYRTDGTAPWVWSDQSKSVFRSWGIGQPNNSGGAQFCVGASTTGPWNDLECTYQLASVCYTVKKRTIVRLEVKSGHQLNDPAKTEILQQVNSYKNMYSILKAY
ncbi:C-type lectin -2-like protein [Labeo rohita]|uniref:C-type lectin-2-like protein n=1 Tax=Labeo rohita TaxID=84645 RepID=A0A498MYP4_LABRO|nr:C-type lectin -2-like protein [Labeo rohita]